METILEKVSKHPELIPEKKRKKPGRPKKQKLVPEQMDIELQDQTLDRLLKKQN